MMPGPWNRFVTSALNHDVTEHAQKSARSALALGFALLLPLRLLRRPLTGKAPPAV